MDTTDPILSRWVGSRHLPPRGEALWRRLGRSLAGESPGDEVDMYMSRFRVSDDRKTSTTHEHAGPTCHRVVLGTN